MDPFTIAMIATGVSGLIKGAGNIIQGQANKRRLEQEGEDLQHGYNYQTSKLEKDTEYQLENIQEETEFQTEQLQREQSRTQGTILAQQAALGIQGGSPEAYLGDVMGVYNNQLQHMTSMADRQQDYIKDSASSQKSYMDYQFRSGQDQISGAKTANTWNTILSTAGTAIGTGAQMMNMDHTQAMQDAQYGTNLSIMDWGY